MHLHSWSLVRADCCSDTPHFWLQGPFSPTFSQLLWAILRDTEVAHCNPCHSAATGSWVGLRCTPVLLLTPGKLFYCFPGDFGVQGSSVKLCVSISQGHVCTGMGWGGALRDRSLKLIPHVPQFHFQKSFLRKLLKIRYRFICEDVYPLLFKICHK